METQQLEEAGGGTGQDEGGVVLIIINRVALEDASWRDWVVSEAQAWKL